MTDETRDVEREAELPGSEETEMDLKAANDELQRRIAQLEEGIASRDGELAALRESLASAAAKYRASALAAEPGVPGELVKGETVEDIESSLNAARDIVAKVRQQLDTEVAAGSVPAGAPPRMPPDLSALSPAEKIAHALATETR
jgi:hypothetical protein